MPRLLTPPGFDKAPLLDKLRHSGLRTDPGYRRAITRTSPTLFGLTYLMDHLRLDDGSVSLSELHLGMARAARTWLRPDIGAGEIRDAWIAPRGGAKSTWAFLVLPLWAMAHEHPAGRYVHAFSSSGRQARKHLKTLRTELATNPRLQRDFPALCGSVENRAEQFVAASGVAMAASGMAEDTNGAKVGSARPSMILLDDVEPDEASYELSTKADRLSEITSKILPMAVNAVVQWTATTTVFDGLAHDLVRSVTGEQVARWVEELGFSVHYFPAIVVDPDGSERSLWPQMWSLEWLRSIRSTRDYALNYANSPLSNSETFWSPADISVDPEARGVRRVLMVDPAVTTGNRSDDTGLAVVGVEPDGARRAVVDVAMGKQATFEELRAAVRMLLHRERVRSPIRRVCVEKNQGGQVWESALAPVVAEFPGTELELFSTAESKEARFARGHDWYQRGWICHSRELPALTNQLLAYPGRHDDIADAVLAGCEVFLRERALTRH